MQCGYKSNQHIFPGPNTDRGMALTDSIDKCRTLILDSKPMSAIQREADESMGLRQPKEMLRYESM